MYELVLASQSPRRKHILTEWGYEFRTYSIEVSEILKKNLTPIEQIRDLAHQKALAAKSTLKLSESLDILLLTADTVVLFENKILGKPKSHADAAQTLRRMSGKKHKVITAFCLWDLGWDRLILEHDISDVQFLNLDDQTIEEYVQTGEPSDKAGSYGIQGKGRALVESYQGSFENIVGLPIQKIENVLRENGWNVRKEPC